MFPLSVDLREKQSGRTALHLAALNGRTKIVEQLLDSSADIQAKDVDRNTCFHLCS
jgi:ankyrin repeat protein